MVKAASDPTAVQWLHQSNGQGEHPEGQAVTAIVGQEEHGDSTSEGRGEPEGGLEGFGWAMEDKEQPEKGDEGGGGGGGEEGREPVVRMECWIPGKEATNAEDDDEDGGGDEVRKEEERGEPAGEVGAGPSVV